tara:strand:- start:10944 stop:11780 length:837 start_codon:yes stop_codon:yes gene_type:complete
VIGIVINLISSRINNVKVINECFVKNKKIEIIYICQLSKNLFKSLRDENIKYTNIYFELASKKSLSSCKNQGIDFFKKKQEINHIWFFDDDCYIDKNIANKLFTKVLNPRIDCFIIKILSKDNKIIGRNLSYLKYLPIFAKYITGGPSIIVKKKSIKQYFDLEFGYGGHTINAEDTKFMIDNNFKNLKFLDDVFIYHPSTKTSIDRIKNYSYGQGFMFKKIPIINFIIFSILTLYRPIFGILINIFKLDFQKVKFYFFRIYYFFRGVKSSVVIKNSHY